MNKTYKLEEGSPQEEFFKCRSMIQGFGGGFANGKTAAICVKGLAIALDYPGSNILMARSTYPKLNDTLRKEFFEWCPESWVKRMPTKDDNTCYLVNGSVVNFRYIGQQGKNAEQTTSNLLSATYDAVFVDQIEDPEITHKDFLDMLGRLRGTTSYRGSDTTMPARGPGWFVFTCNPTANWVYTKLVRPLHRRKKGLRDDDLLVSPKTGEPLLEMIEGSTYTNKHNLRDEYIELLESSYQGQFRDRFLSGMWVTYEGLVYRDFEPDVHVVDHERMVEYLEEQIDNNVLVEFIAGFDHGIASPSCYLLAFVDRRGNVSILDGFYEKEKQIYELAKMIDKINTRYGADNARIFADPSIFRRASTVGQTVGGMFQSYGTRMERGTNDIMPGITKISGYLARKRHHRSPYSGNTESPHLYVSTSVPFVNDEFLTYMWRKSTRDGKPVDEPRDGNDHAMDAIKYLLTPRPHAAKIMTIVKHEDAPYMRWREYDLAVSDKRNHRHGG